MEEAGEVRAQRLRRATLTADEGLRRLFTAEEVAAALRHRLVNKIAAVGALSFHLRRKLPEADELADARAVLPLIDAELAQASEALGTHFLPAAATPPPAARVAEIARAAVRALARPPGVELSGPEPGALAAAIDPAELALALACLVENALEAAEPSGHVRVSCAPGDAGSVVVEVTDDGPGLDAQARARAREPFYTSRPGHVGIGLNIAARVAQRWQGRLELGDASPRGLRARLVLPAARG